MNNISKNRNKNDSIKNHKQKALTNYNELLSNGFCHLMHNSLSSFVQKVFYSLNPGTSYRHNWHIELICDYLEECSRGNITRLIINMPPRMMKSLITSVAWPAWILGKSPHERIMVASYAAQLATKHSLDCRAILQSQWYQSFFSDLKLADDQNQKNKFMTSDGGFRLATSVGGMATGEGGNFLIVDDPLTPLQALHANQRDASNHWFEHTFLSRLDDKQKGVVVVVMQRLHEDDLSGYLLKKHKAIDNGGIWHHLCLPAIAISDEQFHINNHDYSRQQGEVLHPLRESKSMLIKMRQEMGSDIFTTQYQQDPIAASHNNMFRQDWLQYYDNLADILANGNKPIRYIQSWDTAIKIANNHDYTAMISVLETENGWYIIDIWRDKLEYPDLRKQLLAVSSKKLNISHDAVALPSAILIEDKASGQSLLQDLRRDSNLPLIPILPIKDKISRAALLSALFEAKKIFLPRNLAAMNSNFTGSSISSNAKHKKNAQNNQSNHQHNNHDDYITDFTKELLAFPYGTHDDMVDALTAAINWARSNPPPAKTTKPTARIRGLY